MTGIETDDLYELPLQRFVPERDALAKAMRADGRREEAATVARLPKPSVAAWVVNQLVRGNREAVQSLLDAGDALRAAQTAVIEGRGDGHGLRAAAERERAAVDALLGAARGLAGGGGPALSDTIIDRVTDTLHAAAFDQDARRMVGDGRLERELRHVGLGALAVEPVAPARRPPALKPDKAAVREAAKQAEAEAEARRTAKRDEAEARRRADRAARDLARAEKRREQAAQALSEADGALAAAESESEAAAEAHRQAGERLAGL